MKKKYLVLAIIVVITASLVVLYATGPVPGKPVLDNTLPEINLSINQLEEFITAREDTLHVKMDNESKIVWADDSLKNQTDYCLLYLHGNAASGYEGYPTHINFANYFKCNAYIPRLASYGLGSLEPLLDITADEYYESAKEALEIAHILGKKVVIMGTSEGATISLKLAADFPDLVDGLLLLSPNIHMIFSGSFLLTKPWGLQMVRELRGSKYYYMNTDLGDEECDYWNCFYRLEAIAQMQMLIKKIDTKNTYDKITTPVFMAYYYEDETLQDQVSSVDAMLKMFDKLATPEDLKEKQAFNAGTHYIGCRLLSQTQPEVQEACIAFAQNIIGM